MGYKKVEFKWQENQENLEYNSKLEEDEEPLNRVWDMVKPDFIECAFVYLENDKYIWDGKDTYYWEGGDISLMPSSKFDTLEEAKKAVEDYVTKVINNSFVKRKPSDISYGNLTLRQIQNLRGSDQWDRLTASDLSTIAYWLTIKYEESIENNERLKETLESRERVIKSLKQRLESKGE